VIQTVHHAEFLQNISAGFGNDGAARPIGRRGGLVVLDDVGRHVIVVEELHIDGLASVSFACRHLIGEFVSAILPGEGFACGQGDLRASDGEMILLGIAPIAINGIGESWSWYASDYGDRNQGFQHGSTSQNLRSGRLQVKPWTGFHATE
jgi:hypothetical protein